MKYETLLYELEGGVALATMNRPDHRNAMNAQMRADLRHAVRRAGREARVMVLTGAGDVFCAGQDLGDARNIRELDLERTLRDEYHPLLEAMRDCDVPILAAVNGEAAGAGANLALTCDVVFAAESALFVQPFASIGLIPDAGATYWLPRLVGQARAMGAAMLAEPIPARQAAAWGMIWRCLPDDAFQGFVMERARRLAEGPTEAYRQIRRAIRASTQNDWEGQLELEAHLQGRLGRSRDFLEGAAARLEKRAPEFEGR